MKTYRLIRNFKENFSLLVNGSDIQVLFEGGIRTPHLNRGYFRTSDKAVQKALEESPAFNTLYTLESESKSTPVEKIVLPVINEADTTEKGEENEETIVTEITSWIQAASYLRKHFPEEFGANTTKQLVIDGAREKNILFPNWTH